MINSKLRLKLKSFNHELLNSACKKIIILVKSSTSNFITTVPLPTKKRIYCVLRSPHVDKDSREHFEIRIHKRMLDISYDSEISINLFTLLTNMDLPAGVVSEIIFAENSTQHFQ